MLPLLIVVCFVVATARLTGLVNAFLARCLKRQSALYGQRDPQA